jgi:hypothetical protein
MAQQGQQGGSKESGGRGSVGNSGNDQPFWSAGGSGAHPNKGPLSSHSVLTSSPTTPALLLLLVLLLLFCSPQIREWLGSADNLPSPAELSALIWKNRSSLPKANVDVWAKKEFGFYYCQGDLLFGRKPGKLMAQTDALLSGYRPAGRQYCAPNSDEASARSLSLPISSSRK